jgi:ATP-dependent RNA helicase RhlE
MKFADLGLKEPIVRAVADAGYSTPTPIQTQAIPMVLARRDVLGCAQTGTGKTGAFALPILNQLAQRSAPRTFNRSKSRFRTPRALVLSPTRELATQIFESFKTYGRHLSLRHTAIFGGVSKGPQVRALRGGVDTIVATPGRLLDLYRDGLIDFSEIEMLVLDEADHMLDMGFIRDIRKIIDLLPTSRQTLLFSATMPPEIRRLADTILVEPEFIQSAKVASPAESITQSVHYIPRNQKQTALVDLIRTESMGRTLIFTKTKHGADKVVKSLRSSGITSDAIHGNKNQNTRTRTLQAFRNGKLNVLVATDIAARGIDVNEITHVFNYDIPNIPETYVHRIGRTARAGATGIAISFCDREELRSLRAIERLIDRKLDIAVNELGVDTNPKPKRSPANGKPNAHRNGKPYPRRGPSSGGPRPGARKKTGSRKPSANKAFSKR